MSCRARDLYEAVAPMVGDAGVCVSENEEANQEILDALNRANSLLLKRLDAKGTLWFWCVTATAGCFPLPADCLEIRQAWLDGTALEQRDEWFEGKLQVGLQDPACSWNKSHIVRCGGGQIIDIGDGFPAPNPWPQHDNVRLALVAENDADAGKEVVVRYQDVYGNQETTTLVLKGNGQVVLTPTEVREILHVVKPITVGAVVAQVFYAANGRRLPFTRWHSWQTTPSYRRKKLIASPSGCGTLLIKGKRRHIPAQTGDDLLQICDEAALGWAVQALAAMKRRDAAEYNGFLAQAINELEKELQNSQSRAAVAQISFKSPFGRAGRTRSWA